MKIRTLYRCLLALPVVVPGLFFPIRLLHLSPQWLDTFISLSFLAIFVGGIPYGFLVLGLLWWMNGKSERQIRAAMFVAPFCMVASIGLVIVSLVAWEGSPVDDDVFTAWTVYAGYSLALGYFYVALACLVVWLAKRAGWVKEGGG
jgi:hypothetical protein